MWSDTSYVDGIIWLHQPPSFAWAGIWDDDSMAWVLVPHFNQLPPFMAIIWSLAPLSIGGWDWESSCQIHCDSCAGGLLQLAQCHCDDGGVWHVLQPPAPHAHHLTHPLCCVINMLKSYFSNINVTDESYAMWIFFVMREKSASSHWTQDFERSNPHCPVYVREAFAQIEQLAAQGESGETLRHHDQGHGVRWTPK